LKRFTTESAFDSLIAAVPGIGPLRDEHLVDHDELLGHLLMSDIARWIQLPENAGSVPALLERMETLYVDGDDNVQNMVNVSFIEMVDLSSPLFEQFGPQMAASPMTLWMTGKRATYW
jgi:hypothetical protein